MDTCRICRSASTPQDPLFKPCLCRGSIAYIHQPCLQTWLSHSKKSSCELCHSPFQFVNVYKDDMPDRLPLWLVFKRVVRASGSAILILFRGVLVMIVWLGVLPWIAGWLWKTGWSLGEALGRALSDSPPPQRSIDAMSFPTNSTSFFPLVLSLLSHESAAEPIEALWPWIDKFTADIFQGQIVTCFLVLAFVASFLLREWIIQNTPQPIENLDGGVIQQQPQQMRPVERFGPADRPLLDELPPDEQRRKLINALDKGWVRPQDLARPQDVWKIIEEREIEELEKTLAELNREVKGAHSYNEESNYQVEEDRQDASTSSNSITILPPEQFHVPPPTSLSSIDQLNFNTEREESSTGNILPSSSSTSHSLISPSNSNTENEGSLGEDPNPLPDLNEPPKTRTPPPNDLPNPSPFDEPAPPASPPAEEDNDALDFLDFEDSDGEDSAADEDEIPDGGDDRPPAFEDEEILDDLDGIMEAIGFRSVIVLCQNLALMVLLVGLVMGAIVIFPHALGRVIICIKARWVLAPVRALAWVIKTASDKVFGYSAAPTQSSGLSFYTLKMASEPGSVFAVISNWISATLGKPNRFSSFVSFNETFNTLQAEIAGLGVGNRPIDRVTCTLIGYLTIFAIVLNYLQYSRSDIPQNLEQVLRESLRQQVTVLKVAFFIIVELLLFPFVCGILFRFATLPIFPNATMSRLWTITLENPATSLFAFWLVGTAFMFTFAVFVNMVRESVRGGVLWWVRDPSDQNFHPVKEILERGGMEQGRRILTSGALYATLIVVGVGFPFVFLKYALGVLPLRWHLDRPLTHVPIDLLFAHLLLPITIRILKPRRHLKRLWLDCYRLACKQLRLSSYMFSIRSPEEEGSHIRTTWRARLLFLKAPTEPTEECQNRGVIFRKDGTLARAPNHDGVKVVKGRRMIVLVDENGEGKTEEDRKIMREQDAEVLARGDGKEYYTVVYLPPHFRKRVALLVYLMWFMGSLTFAAIVAVPLVLGRAVFASYVKGEVHDAYSYALGFHMIFFVALITRQLARMLRRQRTSPFNVLVNLIISVCKVLPHVLTSFALGVIVIPALFGVTVDLYILSGFREDQGLPTVHLLQDWCHGVVYASIYFRIFRMWGPATSPLNTALDRMNVLWTLRQRVATIGVLNRNILLPLSFTMSKAIFFPHLICISTLTVVPDRLLPPFSVNTTSEQRAQFVQRIVYRGCIVGFVYTQLQTRIDKWISKWISMVRDEEYLSKRILVNREEEDSSPQQRPTPTTNL